MHMPEHLATVGRFLKIPYAILSYGKTSRGRLSDHVHVTPVVPGSFLMEVGLI